MRIGFSSSCAIFAIALTLGGVSTVKAQQTDSTHQITKTTKVKVKKTRSTKHIPVTKESSGEVAPTAPTVNQDSIAAAERARQDSINAANERARQDSVARLEQMRRDSIAAIERRRQDSIAAAERARADSMALAAHQDSVERARLAAMRYHGGWYFGVGGGVSIPTGSYTNAGFNSGGYSTGWNITVPVGYDFAHSPFGLRVDGTFDQLHGRDFNTNFSAPNLDAWSVNADVRLRVPLGRSFSRFYVLGGATYSGLSGWFTDFSDPNNPTNKASTSGSWGWNAGGGFNFNWGSMMGLFLESRYVWVNQSSQVGFPFSHPAWVPIVLGVTF